jgi:cystathionine gamma-synthase
MTRMAPPSGCHGRRARQHSRPECRHSRTFPSARPYPTAPTPSRAACPPWPPSGATRRRTRRSPAACRADTRGSSSTRSPGAWPLVLAERHGLGKDALAGVVAPHGRQAARPPPGVRPGRRRGAFAADGVHGVSHPESTELALRAKLYLQNIGGIPLVARGRGPPRRDGGRPGPGRPRRPSSGTPPREVRAVDAGPCSRGADEDLCLANSGMNAVYAAFRAVNDLQALAGRTGWVQLGWLYLDTIAILRKFTASGEDYIHVPDVMDLAALERLLAERGPGSPGWSRRCPPTRSCRPPTWPRSRALPRGTGEAHPRPVARVGVQRRLPAARRPRRDSLTKYTGSEGDVIAGLVAVNPAAPTPDFLRRGSPIIESPLPARPGAPRRADRQHAGGPRADRGEHPEGGRVPGLAPGRPDDALGARAGLARQLPAGRAVARRDRGDDLLHAARAPGRVLRPAAPAQGPELRHADDAHLPLHVPGPLRPGDDEAGRAELAANGLDPDLLRLCVGTEPADEIIGALDEALRERLSARPSAAGRGPGGSAGGT